MNKIISSGFLFTLLILVSCGKTPIEQKKGELDALKKEAKTIQEKIKKLELEIAKMDTGSKTDKLKVVKLMELNPSNFSHYIELQGELESEDNVLVNPKMGGLVTSVLVNEGQEVVTGQILATIDNAVLQNSIQEIENQLSLAKVVFEKQKRLWEQKIGTEIQFLQAKNNKESLEKRLATAQTQNAMSKIVAPFNGVVDEVIIKVGESVAPGMGGIRVVNMNKLKIIAKVADAYSGKIKKGDKVKIDISDAGIQFESVISYAGLNVSQNSRTFQIEIKVPSTIKNLRPNLIAKISVNDGNLTDALVIPVNLVQKSASGNYTVMVAEEVKGKTIAKPKTVELGSSYNQQVVITSGLNKSDRVIIEGNDDLTDGQELKVIQ